VAIKVEQNCTRCRREIAVSASNFDEAKQVEETVSKRKEGADALRTFVVDLDKQGKLPDVFAVERQANGDLLIVEQGKLCDEDDAKRSCLKTAHTFISQLMTLPPRAPRGSKKKAAGEIPEADVTEIK
jgi:hypothetical protein